MAFQAKQLFYERPDKNVGDFAKFRSQTRDDHENRFEMRKITSFFDCRKKKKTQKLIKLPEAWRMLSGRFTSNAVF